MAVKSTFFKTLAFVSALFVGGCDTNKESAYQEQASRLSDEAQTIEVEYIQDTCDPYTPRFFLIDKNSEKSLPILIALPEGLESPRDSKFAVNGNRFLLEGYLYSEFTNQSGQRLDLTAWKPQSPHSIWNEDEGNAQRVTIDDEIEWIGKDAVSVDSEFGMLKYNDCP